MRPLAQTFIINEPSSGSEAIFLTGIDLYFRSKPSLSSLGIEVQIRETLNGVPVPKQLPYASAVVNFSNIQISSDASVATRFTFETPVILRTNEAFAIAVVPSGGTPDYRLWTARRDDTDVATGSKVVFPNNVGNLYAPSNDISTTVIQNQCLKFNLITANFTASSGTAVYKQNTSEFFYTRPSVGVFSEGERVVVSNNELRLQSLTVSLVTPFTNGEIIVQPNTATNTASATAFGTVYLSNSTVTLLQSTTGKFITTGGGLVGLSSNIATANPSAVFGNTQIQAGNTIVQVPTTTTPGSDFQVNNYIYVGRSTFSNVQVARITGVDSNNRRLTLDRQITITDNDAIIGRVKSDGNLYGIVSYVNKLLNTDLVSLFNSTANSTQNFAGTSNALLIGTNSGTTAVVDTLTNIYYDSITSQIASIDTRDSDVTFRFRGTGNNNSADASSTDLFADIPLEFTDRQRAIYSRSNELTSLSGNKSLAVDAVLSTSTAKFSPYLDSIKSSVVLTSNQIRPEGQLEGVYLNITNRVGTFPRDSVVFQSNATSNTVGKVAFGNSSFLALYDVETSNTSQFATFTANSTSTITSVANGSATVTDVRQFNEALDNGLPIVSRYISKTVVLAEGQDSEDMVVFLTAYRPRGTNIKVYAKLLNAADSDPFDDKSWTPMYDTSPSLFSSIANRDDYVELRYELPQTVAVHTADIVVNTTSDIITFTNSRTTQDFTAGMFVYVTDASTQTFAVRRVLSVPNTSALIVRSNLTFDSSNAAIGYIPDSLVQCNAFRYTDNSGIVRYVCSSSESVYDGFKIFAVKIVLTSDTTQIVPRVADMRTLALQI
jgi:hypothetical protein